MSDLHKMSFRFLLHLKKTLGGCGKQYESSDSIPLCLFKMKDSLDICGWYCVKRSFGILLTLSVGLDLSSKNSFLSTLQTSSTEILLFCERHYTLLLETEKCQKNTKEFFYGYNGYTQCVQ